jgi:diguanylate cyclase (GGDEF)-like protein
MVKFMGERADLARMGGGSWLFRGDVDRARMVDMDRRLQPIRRAALAVLGVALIASGPWMGWWTIVPLVVAGALFRLADARMDRVSKPEHALFAAWVGSEVIIAASVALTGGPGMPTMSWLAIPIVTLSARFSTRGIVAGVTITLALLLAVSFGMDAAQVLDNPPLVLAPAAMIVAIAILSTALMHSDVEHRNDALIDELTGMLNRTALGRRVEELAQQSAVSGEPVGVIVADIDRFKEVNDSRGHAAGDVALREVGVVLRKHLRAFDLAYRLGGEEFLLLVPGAGIEQATTIAEGLCEGVRHADLGDGLSVTMSFGVDASEAGEPFDYDAAFAGADGALYEAKAAGRDCVRATGAVVAA